MKQYNIFHSFPHELLSIKASEIYKILKKPTLFILNKDTCTAPIFISTLLHGNEPSGFFAIQKYLIESNVVFPRPVILFIGNVDAAQFQSRHLAHETDYNRLWTASHDVANEILAIIKRERPVFAVDFHNTTGINPPHSALTGTSVFELNLASFFAPIAVHYKTALGTLTQALNMICPSIAVECGKNDDENSHQIAYDFLKKILNIPCCESISSSKLTVFESLATIKIPHKKNVSFLQNSQFVDFNFRSNLDIHNFKVMKKGELLGHGKLLPWVLDLDGKDMAHQFIELIDGKIVVKNDFLPALITTIAEVAKSDCLMHIMKRV